jgi:hypothetical protein
MRKLVLTHLRHQFVEDVRTVAPLLAAMLITLCMTAIANDERHPLKKLRPRLILEWHEQEKMTRPCIAEWIRQKRQKQKNTEPQQSPQTRALAQVTDYGCNFLM